MYFFARFNGFVTIMLGILMMLFGVGLAIYGFVQNDALVDLVNNYMLMCTSGWGQLQLVFVDTAINTRETNLLLRAMRRVE